MKTIKLHYNINNLTGFTSHESPEHCGEWRSWTGSLQPIIYLNLLIQVQIEHIYNEQITLNGK